MTPRRFPVLLVMLVACGGSKPTGESPAPGVPDAAPAIVTPAPADAAAPAPTTDCPEDLCCRTSSGDWVRPGGCQPSYPDDVQPATVRGDDGDCEPIECHLKCLPVTARIATPSGEVPVDQLAAGDPVWSVDAGGARVEARVLMVRSIPVRGSHQVVEVTLDDGRSVRASAGHPLAGSGTVGDLAPGDRLDGATVITVRALAYDGAATWDLLPDGPTGLYWADGVLLGSTLSR